MESLCSIAHVDRWLAGGAPQPVAIIGVDLRPLDALFEHVGLAGCAFLGCQFGEVLAVRAHRDGAGIVTEQPVLPAGLSMFAQGIYTVADLYRGMRDDGSGWEATPDHAGFRFFNVKKNLPRALSTAEAVAARLHDTVQERAVASFLKDRDVVAIMGGHDAKRRLDPAVDAGTPDVYWDCVQIAQTLTEEGFLIVTGGGPGLMEAGNLGALLAGASPKVVSDVRALLTNESFEHDSWRATAMEARARILGSWTAQPDATRYSLGIPTWLYGHEPPNLFASHHSKMFFNSLREDGLVTLANKGIIFFEGNAGTIQEIFQDATQNYYRPSLESATPMVFYNAGGYWDRPCDDLTSPTAVSVDRRKPLLPLVRQLAAEKRFTDAVAVTASASETIAFLKRGRSDQKTRKADVHLGNVTPAR
jgi:predicted Rossmann-fold nucleotide-binding protein